jgi:hypothetical protein
MAERTYSTGQAGLTLGISSYKVRALCEAGAIDAELTDTGRWKIGAHEIARLQKAGIPAIRREPAESSDAEAAADDETPQSANGTAPKPALYGPPSKKLIAAKEKAIRLQNQAEALRHQLEVEELQRQIRAAQRAEREEEEQRSQERRRDKWLKRWLDYSMSRAPSGLHSQIRTRVVNALDDLPTDDPSTRERVDEIVLDERAWRDCGLH